MSGRLDRVKDWDRVAAECGFELQAITRRYGVSGQTLRRHFRKQFGIGPKVWIDSRRIEVALEHLTSGNLVKTAAADLRFKQRSHFSKFFKRVKGAAPTKYQAKEMSEIGTKCPF